MRLLLWDRFNIAFLKTFQIIEVHTILHLYERDTLIVGLLVVLVVPWCLRLVLAGSDDVSHVDLAVT